MQLKPGQFIPLKVLADELDKAYPFAQKYPYAWKRVNQILNRKDVKSQFVKWKKPGFVRAKYVMRKT